MLRLWCQMDTALSPQLLPLISNTEQVVTLSGCHRVTYPSLSQREFFQRYFTFNMCFKLRVLVVYVCLRDFGPGWPYRNATEWYWDIDLIPLGSVMWSHHIHLEASVNPKYFSMFKMDPFHLIISAISNSPPLQSVLLPPKPERIWSPL